MSISLGYSYFFRSILMMQALLLNQFTVKKKFDANKTNAEKNYGALNANDGILHRSSKQRKKENQKR